jgi:hypothetical protein
MNRLRVFALTAAVAAGMSAPALADEYVRLGSVDVGFRMDRDTSWTRFGGGMEGLRLEADRSDIRCRSIVAQFGDGTRQNVFSGQLRDNRPIEVDLRGGTRRVRNISFTCRSDERDGGKIFIAANVGRYRSEWQGSPDWMVFWSRLFRWGPAPVYQADYDPNYWVTLGRQRFEGRGDRESTVTGWAGRSVDRLGFRALDDDAMCPRVRVTFGNGQTSVLDVGPLDQGRMKRVDLPGDQRNVTGVVLACRAVNRQAVTVEISARK